MSKQTKIVIVGAGFAGLSAALNLEKRFKNNLSAPRMHSGHLPLEGEKAGQISITLIDKHDYHLFLPNLHEVATAEEEMASIDQLKKSIAIQLKEILAGKDITFVKGEVVAVENPQRRVRLASKTIEYDYLVLALGTVPDYLDIQDVQNFALPLCSLSDALRIRNEVEFLVQAHRMDQAKKPIHIVIAGGGPSSVEFTGELSGLADRVAWKYGFPREKVNITVLESSGQLLPGLGERAGRNALLRLKELGVQAELEKTICSVDRQFVEFEDAEKMQYDLLVWNAGERGPKMNFEAEVAKDTKDKLKVDRNLLLLGDSHIFVIGDSAVLVDQNGAEVHGGGVQWALAQAGYLTSILPLLLQNIRPKAFDFKSSGHIVNIGGKWGLAILGRRCFMGFTAFLLSQWVRLNYFRRIIGWPKALKYWWMDEQLYGRND